MQRLEIGHVLSICSALQGQAERNREIARDITSTSLKVSMKRKAERDEDLAGILLNSAVYLNKIEKVKK